MGKASNVSQALLESLTKRKFLIKQKASPELVKRRARPFRNLRMSSQGNFLSIRTAGIVRCDPERLFVEIHCHGIDRTQALSFRIGKILMAADGIREVCVVREILEHFFDGVPAIKCPAQSLQTIQSYKCIREVAFKRIRAPKNRRQIVIGVTKRFTDRH